MSNYIGGIIGNSMQTGLQTNLKNAIESAGAIVPESACLWEYPEIIRKNLTANTISNVNLKAKDIINIYSTVEDDVTFYNISTLYNTNNVSRPNYSSNNDEWQEDMSVDKVFDDLFDNILPNVRGVHAGDVTNTDEYGNDNKIWENTLFNVSGNKFGLKPNANYIRLYLTCQPEPIYVHIEGAVNDLTRGYNVKNSDTIEFEINDIDKTLSAHIACITTEQLNDIK